jgi:hypothetical protein
MALKVHARRSSTILSMQGIAAIVFIALLIWPAHANARQVHVVRFIAAGPIIDPPCGYLQWVDELAFHNTGVESATIRPTAVSNGVPRPDATDLVVPPGRTRTVRGKNQSWNPADEDVGLWVNQLEVPSAVVMTSRLVVVVSTGAPCALVAESRNFGATALPVFAELRPPNERQYHLGTDLGADRTGHAASARLNVGVYNGGTSSATARIEVHQGCDDAVTESRAVTIPANTIVQIPGLSHTIGPGCATVGVPAWISYVVVAVDQPSFSYVVSLSNELPPKIPIGVAFTR